ncbi:3-hydroxybenzoate 4-monooxygenase [Agromyces intestinalis]|uniref:3-hydroxybenzoate 4-monooxygenase n=1 Tax=Agromyces intestinalis TaxID=2592652 RepID=A0A5C1YFT4_9MICO|nr:FAD-binding monooxygenase [Agromyces intestinalis]QEO13879.1 3-hydroxybenzoate 4-monooxygenase [Agromyces intestinalis]
MQFHHHGYVSGDPRVEPAAGIGLDRPTELPDEVDVLIVGSGPAGMIAAAQLAQFPDVSTRLIERRDGRLVIGQADGIQARSVETFQAFGFAERIIAEAYRITEMAFWKPDVADPSRIVRTAVAPDDPTGISEFPHLIVNQARVLDHFAEFAANSPGRITPDYGWEFLGLEVDETAAETVAGEASAHPVAVRVRRTAGDDAGQERTIRAQYVIGADGARSRVRDAIGCRMAGDRANHAWGVMDVLVVTDFPDIRTKCSIQSEAGNILLIPREGGHLFRMYVDLGEVAPDDAGAVRATTIEQIIAKANAIMHPYTLDVRHVAWHSVYEVGHRLTDRFDDVPADAVERRHARVFITGDACHTHSAKAGQGMNVSMQDGWNIAWKLGHVLEGRAPAALLETYSAERQVVAANLIDFDRTWSSMMARKPEEFDSPTELEDFYVRTAEFPAGFMTEYAPSLIVGGAGHQPLATGYPIGKRFRSAPVARVCDGNPVQLGHHARADGRWRIYAFADAAGAGETSGPALSAFAEWLSNSPDSPLAAVPDGVAPNDWYDVKVVYQQPHGEVDLGAVPRVFLPATGPFGLTDYEHVYAVDPADDVFDARGVDRGGVVVVVRPDQYVANVLPLTATDELALFFAPIVRKEPAAVSAGRR